MNRHPAALEIWQYGKAYQQAANQLVRVAGELNVTAPIYYLYCHAIELALKGYLRAHGVTLDELKGLRHRLQPLLKRARTHGLDQGTPTKGYIDLTAALDAYIKEHEFRYVITSLKRLPMLNALRDATERLLSATRATCWEHD